MTYSIGPNDKMYPLQWRELTAAEARCYGGEFLATRALAALENGNTKALRKLLENAIAAREKMRPFRISGIAGSILVLMDGIDARHLEIDNLRRAIAHPNCSEDLRRTFRKRLKIIEAELAA